MFEVLPSMNKSIPTIQATCVMCSLLLYRYYMNPYLIFCVHSVLLPQNESATIPDIILVILTCFQYLLIRILPSVSVPGLDKEFDLLTMFARLTCLVYYIGCYVSLYMGSIQLMRAQASSMYNRLFILLIQVDYLSIDVSPTSLPQWPTLLFLLIFIMYKHITLNTIYYHSHTFYLMTYNVSIMYTA